MLIFVLSWNEPCMFGQGLSMIVKEFLFVLVSMLESISTGQ